MSVVRSSSRFSAHRLGKCALGAFALCMLTACNQTGGGLAGFASSDAKGPKSSLALASATQSWARRYEKNPNDIVVAINYGRHLRAVGNSNKALEVLTGIAEANPTNPDIAAEVGRAALEANDLETADKAFAVAEKGPKDWRLMSALGTLKAKQGNHKKAQDYYVAALELNPKATSVQNNLALSYSMDGKRDKAEALIKTAALGGDQRVRQNVALVLGKGRQGGGAPVKAAAETKVAAASPPALPLDEDEDPKVADDAPFKQPTRTAARGLFGRGAISQAPAAETTASIAAPSGSATPATIAEKLPPLPERSKHSASLSEAPSAASAKPVSGRSLPWSASAQPRPTKAEATPAAAAPASDQGVSEVRWPWSRKPAAAGDTPAQSAGQPAESMGDAAPRKRLPADASPLDILPMQSLATPPGDPEAKPKFALASVTSRPAEQTDAALSRVADWTTTVTPSSPQ